MLKAIRSKKIRSFLLVWSGQSASLIGSSMTQFVLSIWAWELTGKATALALVSFFTLIPQLIISPFAGAIIDRWNRKFLMMTGDTISVLTTLLLLLLYLSGNLQIWHLYISSALSGAFGQLQELAYSTSISLMVPKQHYDRASSLTFIAGYGADIFAPALAGILYPMVGLVGIWCVDIATFAIAISTVLRVKIPQNAIASTTTPPLWTDLIFGFRYLLARPSLILLLLCTAGFWFAHDLGAALYAPMVLARTGNQPEVLASVYTAAGVGGVIGALVVSIFGTTKRRIHGVLLGMIGAGLSKTVFGLANTFWVWVPAQFFSSLNFPLMGSASDAIWLSKVNPGVQGRVFATRSAIMLICSPIAYAIAGPLADNFFEPAMQANGILAPTLGRYFGTAPGAGIAVLYVISSVSLFLIGMTAYSIRNLRNIETIVPDFHPTDPVRDPL